MGFVKYLCIFVNVRRMHYEDLFAFNQETDKKWPSLLTPATPLPAQDKPVSVSQRGRRATNNFICCKGRKDLVWRCQGYEAAYTASYGHIALSNWIKAIKLRGQIIKIIVPK